MTKSLGCAHARARVGDVIEPAALRRNGAYREFFNSIILSRKINYHTTLDPRYIYIYRPEEYNCQMYELMFQAGVKGMSERSELIPCNVYIYR